MYKIGYSEDIHQLVPNRKLMLGGVHIPFELGEKAHSDGDVLLHAICESIIGALALGDLGKLFPDNDDKYKDISSEYFLNKVYEMINELGYEINNIDSSIVLEKPKLSKYIDEMRNNIARILHIELNQISIKACTNEGLGEIGEGKAIKAVAITLLRKVK